MLNLRQLKLELNDWVNWYNMINELLKLETFDLTNSEKIEALELACLDQEQVSCDVTHSFGPGVYIRQVTIPAGTFAIGHHQNLEHMNVMVKGKVSMIADDGTINILTAPFTYVAKPGRKISYVHEDVVWLNIYSTTETDVEKLEATYLTKSNSFIGNSTQNKLKLIKKTVDIDDFKTAINELGFTEEQFIKILDDNSDIEPLSGSYKIKVGDSSIREKGLIATSSICINEVIAPARLGTKRTIAGRYVNHSKTPNAKMVNGKNGNVYLLAIKDIAGCLGGQDGEEITINYRDTVNLTLSHSVGE